jgi:hypothetical protein
MTGCPQSFEGLSPWWGSRGQRPIFVPSMTALALCMMVSAVPAHADQPAVIGWTEHVVVAAGPRLAAKIDTGAVTSSLDARAITTLLKDGREWARFSVIDAAGKAWPLEAEIVRRVRIRRAGAEPQSRIVVELMLCVAGKSGPAEFTLTDRDGQETAVLVGRAFLAGKFVVDSAATETAPDSCSR